MSKKRPSTESNDGEQINEASDLFQQDDYVKRRRLTPACETTLHDLPIEVLECILVKAITMEVKELKLAKRVWIEKADFLMSRLIRVCSRWSSILTTDFVRNKVHRILDGAAQKMIRLEILHQSSTKLSLRRVATIRDEMFMLYRRKKHDCYINVLNRDNMATVKAVIPLPGIRPKDMAACSVSNCVYVGLINKEDQCLSVLRMAKDEHKYKVSPWINALSSSFYSIRLFVSISGSLIILCERCESDPTAIKIYGADGNLRDAITLYPAIHGDIFSVIEKSNGNLVLATMNETLKTDLKEIDSNGRIVRQYCSPVYGHNDVTVADAYGRIMIASTGNRGELLDSEFNLLDLTLPPRFHSSVQISRGIHYNRERNEVVRLYRVSGPLRNKVLTIFRFTDE